MGAAAALMFARALCTAAAARALPHAHTLRAMFLSHSVILHFY
jgi:hypothetical protein